MLTSWLKQELKAVKNVDDHVVLRFPDGAPAMLRYEAHEWSSLEEIDELFEFLLMNGHWKQNQSEMGLEHRLSASFSESEEYEYNGIVNKSQPSQSYPIIAKTNGKFRKIGIIKDDEGDPSYWFCGLYRDEKDTIGAHYDKLWSLDITKPIISMSFGESRVFRITKNHSPIDFTLPRGMPQKRKSLWSDYDDAKTQRKLGKKRKRGVDFVMDLPLHHGTLVVMMPGHGDYFKHAIPPASPREIATGLQLEATRVKKRKWTEMAAKLPHLTQKQWDGKCKLGLRINVTARFLAKREHG